MKKGALVFILLLVTAVVLAYGVSRRGEAAIQPIKFNHAVHINEASLSCTDCHLNARSGRYAGIPGKNLCFDCHDIDDEQETHPEKDRLFAFYDVEDDIPWVRVEVTRPDVFFSHCRHVASGGLGCLDCHPDQDHRREPPAVAKLVMRMGDCIACHQIRRVSTDCLACHR